MSTNENPAGSAAGTTTNITIGILAHVDAGKTTLSESILYMTGEVKSQGRVDHKDAFLDTEELEKARGITIFSKMARFGAGTKRFTLLDTPGHVDFSPEMERTLRVLDYAILVISAPDIWGRKALDAQVRVIVRLLAHYHVPFMIFVNKTDQLADENAGEDALMQILQAELGSSAVRFDDRQLCPDNEESVAVLDDALLERCLEGGHVVDEDVTRLIAGRRLMPVYFGAALYNEGTQALLDGMGKFMQPASYEEKFGAFVYKVSRDGAVRLTWMKLTGGSLAIRDEIEQTKRVPVVSRAAAAAPADADSVLQEQEETIREKVSGIRLYSGNRFTDVTKAEAGEIIAVAGLSATRIGDGLGAHPSATEELLSPIMTCSVTAGKDVDDYTLMQALRAMEEEEPMLHVGNDERTGEINVQIMGDVQTQILRTMMKERFGFDVTFGPGSIVYKETIRRPVEGVGHFEPLRHYAEVHLLLEPTGTGSGLSFENRTPPNTLDKNWQNLIMTHLQEKLHRGVLTGSEITDMRISLIGGRASVKHTEGGDFRKATYRAVRQGLMMAQNILLEPVLSFRLELPASSVGRALTDLDGMRGKCRPPEFSGDMAILEGTVPASTLGSYAREVVTYTGGRGRLHVTLKDYEPCHNAAEVIGQCGYDPDADRRNPSYSVFCSHGAGTVVTWQNVRKHMHVDTGWTLQTYDDQPQETYLTNDYFTFHAVEEDEAADLNSPDYGVEDMAQAMPGTAAGEQGAGWTARGHNLRAAGEESYEARERAYTAQEKELESIFERTYGPVKRQIRNPENERLDRLMEEYVSERQPGPGDPKYTKTRQEEPMQEFLLVDGYNIIFAWEELKALAVRDIKAARDQLLDILSNYAGYAKETVIVVFDAYKVIGGRGEVYRYHNIDVVYTKEAETADLYIEKTAHTLSKKHRVYVATSDAVEQVIIFSSGAYRLSARGLLEQIIMTEQRMKEKYRIE